MSIRLRSSITLVSIGGAGSMVAGVRVSRYITDPASNNTKSKNAHFPILTAFVKNEREFIGCGGFMSALVALLALERVF